MSQKQTLSGRGAPHFAATIFHNEEATLWTSVAS